MESLSHTRTACILLALSGLPYALPAAVFTYVGRNDGSGNVDLVQPNSGTWGNPEIWDDGNGQVVHTPSAGNTYIVDDTAAGLLLAQNLPTFAGDSLEIQST